jgi:hypothetical protein
VGESGNVGLDSLLDVGESAIGSEVGADGVLEIVKFASELSFVKLALAILFFVFDDEDGAIVAEEADDI